MLASLRNIATAAFVVHGLFAELAAAQIVSQIPDGQIQVPTAITKTVSVCPTGSSLAKPAASSSVYHNAKDKNGAVASESAVCSQIGIDLLKAGGNAADAMVGTVLCIGVIAMYHSGLGGGGFMLVRSANGTYEYIDFRETAPAASTENMYTNNSALSLYGGMASGVPGELRGLEHLHKSYGKLAWKTVVAPSVNVARNGFKVTSDTVRYFTGSSYNFLVTDPSWALDFAPNGTKVGLGDIMYRKRYANTLEMIGEHGADIFYTGAIANATIQALKKTGGIMTLADLKDYKVAIRKPSVINYKGSKITSCSAPAGGVVALSALNIFSGYNFTGTASAINLTTHLLDESMRWAYGQRTNLGDPSFVANLTAYTDSMLSVKTASEIRAKISDTRTFDTAYYDPAGIESLPTPGTSHIVAADASGMAISLTTTVNLIFGSQVMVPETGVIMNDEMNDFSIPGSSNAFGYIPSPANYVRPGKRPLSSISPTIVEYPNGTLHYVIGSAGGSRIITATIQNIWHVLDQGMTAPQALAQPRLHDQLTPATTSFEYSGLNIIGYDNSTVAYMKGLGHNVSWIAPGQSTAQGIVRLGNGTFQAAGEPRQSGSGGFAY